MTEESTTPDLVELVRKQVEALDRGDLDGVMSSVAEDTVLDGRADFFEGRAAIRGFLEEWSRAYEELDFELEEVSDLGGGVVFAVVIQDGRLVGADGRLRQREGWGLPLCRRLDRSPHDLRGRSGPPSRQKGSPRSGDRRTEFRESR